MVGGILVGSGKMRVDNLRVTIDDKTIENAKPKELTIAQQDKEFDTNSGIALINLTQQEIENATVLGQVWGFLKYHHPDIASGNYNWDYELFRVMQPIIKASNPL